MGDPAKNPYAASSATPGAPVPAGSPPATINAAATTGTLITFALIGGVITITGILTFLVLSDPPEGQSYLRFDGNAMLFIAIGYGAFLSSSVAAFVLRGAMKKQAMMQLHAADEDLPQPLTGDSPLLPSGQRFLGAVTTYTLVGQALMEGTAVINAVFMFIDENLALAIPIALAAIGIAIQIPTAGGIQSLMEDAKRGREM